MLKTKFLNTVKNFHMTAPGDTVLVGFSGGADSVCLISLFLECKEELGISVKAAHVNHCLRGEESERDEAFVRSFCQTRDIELFVYREDVGTLAKAKKCSVELCAREVRYDFFRSLGFSRIATAHTGSDAMETFLMNLSRGSSLHGLCSIPPVRGEIIRPLIEITRDEVEAYCKENSLSYVSDSTNFSEEYTRNKYRLSVIPRLKEINPAFESSVLRCITALRADDEYLEERSAAYFESNCDKEKKILNVQNFSRLHSAVRRRVIVKYFTLFSSDYEMKHVILTEENVSDPHFGLTLPSGVRIFSDGVFLYPAEEKTTYPFLQFELRKEEQTVFDFYHTSVALNIINTDLPKDLFYGSCVDYDKIDDIVFLRSPLSGDKFTFSKRNCTKTLKKYFTEEKLPAGIRNTIPVLSDSRGVIWVKGAGVNKSRLPDKNSERIIIISAEDLTNE